MRPQAPLKPLVAVLLALAPLAAVAQTVPLPPKIAAPSGHYAADPTHASVTMTWRHMGLERYQARFARVSASVDYDAADPTRSRLEATIPVTSLRTDFPDPAKIDFDAELAGWLGAKTHPDMRYVSRRIVRTGPDRGRIEGDLTLNGVTRPVALDAVWRGAVVNPLSKAITFGVSATGVVHRSEFGVAQYVPLVGDDIEFRIEAEFVKS